MQQTSADKKDKSHTILITEIQDANIMFYFLNIYFENKQFGQIFENLY